MKINVDLAYYTHNTYYALFSIFFAIRILIGVYFVCCKYMNHNKENISKYDYVYKTKHY